MPSAQDIEMYIRDGLHGSTDPITLVYIHDGEATITRKGVQTFRRIHAALSSSVQDQVQRILLLHASVSLRLSLYRNAGRDYSKLHSCELIEDLETQLGVDSVLLSLSRKTVQYDEVLRVWNDRHEKTPAPKLDPAKPLLHFDKVQYSAATDQDTTVVEHQQHGDESSGV